MRQEIRVPGLCEPLSHYTDVVRYGNLVFLSGAGPLDSDGRLVGANDVSAQARQVHTNMELMLNAVGARFEDILKVTVYVTDINDRQAIDEVRKEFFGGARPTSTLIEVRNFVIPNMKLEIEAVVGVGAGT